jgi:gamma-glutamyl hercynylcysteine S-oxide hydrolase
MCRHLAYVGEPVRLGALLVDPPHSLYRQAWEPRRQHHGIMNADGFGVGWYVTGEAEPARHRAGVPIWNDATFVDLARVIRTSAVLAAVRSATAGMAAGAAAAAPFRCGPWLFSHNGALAGWPEAAAALAAELPPHRLIQMDAPTDAALLWALTLERLQSGTGLMDALADVARRAVRTCGGRVNLLVTDGAEIAATARGASLVYREIPTGVLVASEPHDDEPGWHDVPDDHVLHADRGGVVVRPLT